MGGFLVFLYEILLTIFLVEVFDWWYVYAYLVALLSGMVFLFLYHSRITFQKGLRLLYWAKFFLLYSFIYLIALMIVVIAALLRIHYIFSILLSSISLSLLSYHANRKWVFVE